MAGNKLYINCVEDYEIAGSLIASGSSLYTDVFPTYGQSPSGTLALYIICEGLGQLKIEYETAPGGDGETSVGYAHEWFPGIYRNPIKESIGTGMLAIPMTITVGRYLRFKLTAVSGDVTITNLKLVTQ